MASDGPKPVAKARYGLQKVQAGMYLHRSGRYILKTGEHEGPQGGMYERWDVADWLGGWTVDALPYLSLREAAEALDEEPHTDE
jgi:hypothetical protein